MTSIYQAKTRNLTLFSSIVLVVSLIGSPVVTLAEQAQVEGSLQGDFQETVTGSFDGVDLKSNRVWINDFVYNLDSAVKIKGTSVKLGLLSDLKQGEMVKAYLSPNEDEPSIPYVIVIERQ